MVLYITLPFAVIVYTIAIAGIFWILCYAIGAQPFHFNNLSSDFSHYKIYIFPHYAGLSWLVYVLIPTSFKVFNSFIILIWKNSSMFNIVNIAGTKAKATDTEISSRQESIFHWSRHGNTSKNVCTITKTLIWDFLIPNALLFTDLDDKITCSDF